MHTRVARAFGALLAGSLGIAAMVFDGSRADAQVAPLDLGAAEDFAVLAAATVTNTGPSVIDGDLGVSPGTAVTGFPPGTVTGTVHSAGATAAQAQADATAAYDDGVLRTPATAVPVELGGTTLTGGVYAGGTLEITGTLTLDAQGDPNAVFILRAASTLVTASNSTVELINGAQASNVFWLVGSSATLGTGTHFVGTIIATASITATTGVTVLGRLLARTAAVTLDTNTVDVPPSAPSTPPTTVPGGGTPCPTDPPCTTGQPVAWSTSSWSTSSSWTTSSTTSSWSTMTSWWPGG
jgi:type VI secretion system secreted protein VgrG